MFFRHCSFSYVSTTSFILFLFLYVLVPLLQKMYCMFCTLLLMLLLKLSIFPQIIHVCSPVGLPKKLLEVAGQRLYTGPPIFLLTKQHCQSTEGRIISILKKYVPLYFMITSANYHCPSNLLPHYLAKCKRSTVQLYIHIGKNICFLSSDIIMFHEFLLFIFSS